MILPTSTLKAALILFLGVLLYSCGLLPDKNKKENSKTVIVEVNDDQLTASELKKLLNSSMSEADSSELAALYINQWINYQLLLEKAEDLQESTLLNIEQRVSEYRNQLIALEVKNLIVSNNLDTAVTNEELKKYYEQNKVNFRLNEPIVKCLLVKYRNDVPNTGNIESTLRNYKKEKKQEITEFCLNLAESCHLNDTIWVEFNNLVYASPFKSWENPVTKFKQSSFHKVQSKDYTYLLKVIDYKDVDEESPLEFEKKILRNIIINNRKKELLKKYQEDIYRSAKENNEIILHY